MAYHNIWTLIRDVPRFVEDKIFGYSKVETEADFIHLFTTDTQNNLQFNAGLLKGYLESGKLREVVYFLLSQRRPIEWRARAKDFRRNIQYYHTSPEEMVFGKLSSPIQQQFSAAQVFETCIHFESGLTSEMALMTLETHPAGAFDLKPLTDCLLAGKDITDVEDPWAIVLLLAVLQDCTPTSLQSIGRHIAYKHL